MISVKRIIFGVWAGSMIITTILVALTLNGII